MSSHLDFRGAGKFRSSIFCGGMNFFETSEGGNLLGGPGTFWSISYTINIQLFISLHFYFIKT